MLGDQENPGRGQVGTQDPPELTQLPGGSFPRLQDVGQRPDQVAPASHKFYPALSHALIVGLWVMASVGPWDRKATCSSGHKRAGWGFCWQRQGAELLDHELRNATGLAR